MAKKDAIEKEIKEFQDVLDSVSPLFHIHQCSFLYLIVFGRDINVSVYSNKGLECMKS